MIKMFITPIFNACICYVEISDGEFEKISKQLYLFWRYIFLSKVNSSVGKIYISRPKRDQLRKMQLQGLRLGIEPATLDR